MVLGAGPPHYSQKKVCPLSNPFQQAKSIEDRPSSKTVAAYILQKSKKQGELL